MKKLMTAIFALSAMTTFANLDQTSTTVEVKANIKTQSQLIIASSEAAYAPAIHTVVIDHGTIDKTDVENPTNLFASSGTLFVKRFENDAILFNSSQNSLNFEFEDEDFTLQGVDNGSSITTELNIMKPLGLPIYSTKAVPFTINSNLNKASVLAAPAGNYALRKVLNVTITD